MIETDVVVVGAGPAGATAALNLAPARQVVLVDQQTCNPPRMGESLPPAARRLFSDMGLLEPFLREPHLPCYGNRAFWGDGGMTETDFLRDPDGHGWHIDRTRFDAWLRRAAIARGANLAIPARLETAQYDGAYWRVQLTQAGRPIELHARVVIDCGGRSAPVVRRVGARVYRVPGDRLVCAWAMGRARNQGSGAGFSVVEAAEDGWWYTAPMPDERRVVAFFTDSRLSTLQSRGNGPALLERANAAPEIGSLLRNAEFALLHAGWRPAYTSWTGPCAGPGWIAAGDASISLDPLSAQGLLHALFTGLAAAEAADGFVQGDPNAHQDYQRALDQIRAAYFSNLKHCYAAETRWAAAPFWKQRSSSGSEALTPTA